MTAKQKPADDKDKSTGSYVEPNKDPELEKRVDALMSADEKPVMPEAKDNKITDGPETKQPTNLENEAPSADEKSGAPLLPSDKLPNLEKLAKADSKKNKANTPKEAAVTPEPISSTPTPQANPPAEPVGVEEATPDLKDELGLEDDKTNQAVDEILASEADELLEAHNPPASNPEMANLPSKTAKAKQANPLKRFFSAWWHNKIYRNATIAAAFLSILAVGIVPSSRYYVLNTAGVRVSSSVKVLDQTTGQPLKNADFSIGGTTGKTDSEGQARLRDLRLGPSTLTIKKPAFAEVSQPVTLGWGSNPLGEFKLKAVGSQYTFVITDFVSRVPITKAEATSGSADARTNDKGELTLTIPQSEAEKDEITVRISAENYRTENITLPTAQKDKRTVELVPARKHVFVSKRSGKFDLYKIDVDGKNEEKILSGTGSERLDSMAVSIHPTKNLVALVSNRGDSRNGDGFKLSTLTLIDLEDNQASKVTQSERVQLIEWVGNKLIYVKIAEGTSAASSDRHRLISYDLTSKTERELAATNYFNDVIAVNGSIYYSPAMYQVNGSVGLFKINADGNYKKTVYDKEVWNIFRTAYDKLHVSIGQDWFELNLSNDVMTRADSPPSIPST